VISGRKLKNWPSKSVIVWLSPGCGVAAIPFSGGLKKAMDVMRIKRMEMETKFKLPNICFFNIGLLLKGLEISSMEVR